MSDCGGSGAAKSRALTMRGDGGGGLAVEGSDYSNSDGVFDDVALPMTLKKALNFHTLPQFMGLDCFQVVSSI